MTNHVHFIAVPQSETALARAFGEAHRRYTRMKNFEEGARGYLFQGRFSSVVLDERHLMAAARYIELNPVRACMVGHAWEYAWSSAAFHAELRAVDPLVKEKTLPMLAGNWREFLSGSDEKEMDALRMATRTGRPVGDEEFLTELSKITGKKVTRSRPGRPRKKAGTEME
jgi:putative transposase